MVVPGNRGQSVGLINTATDFSQFFKPQEVQPLANQSKQQNYQQTLVPENKEEPVQIQQKSSYFNPTPALRWVRVILSTRCDSLSAATSSLIACISAGCM